MAVVSEAFVDQFGALIMHLAQQKSSRLRSSVFLKTGVIGKRVKQDQLGPGVAVKRTTRNEDTILQTPDHQARWASIVDYEYAKLLDQEDELKTLTDPVSAYIIAAVSALGRAMDDEIIISFDGSAATGEAGSGTQAFDSTNNDVAAAGDGLTLTKLLAGVEIINGNDIDPDEPRFVVYSAKQMTNLFNTTEIKSADFNTVKALAEGRIDTFLGYKFIRSERLGTDSNGDRKVFMYTMTGIMLAIQREITASIDKRPDKSNAIQALAKLGLGAVRLEEKKVVRVACVES